jgi:hypothetical protein
MHEPAAMDGPPIMEGLAASPARSIILAMPIRPNGCARSFTNT